MQYRFTGHILDSERRELVCDGKQVGLEPQVFDTLSFLIANRDRVVTKEDLLAAVWSGRFVSDSAVASRIAAARRAIGDSGEVQRFIRTIHGKGFRFVSDVREEPGQAATGVGREPLSSPALLDHPSLAVLAFDNMSDDPEQEYFADGVAEEIITALSRIRGLFVIARNSSFVYKGRSVDVKQVGRELGVRYVLEGSIRKAGGNVRVTAQLIDASSGMHIWAERFEGPLKGIFELQDRVAGAVASVIEPTLQAAELRSRSMRPTTDLSAYDLYLRAFWESRTWDRGGNLRAIDLLAEAIERDPRYGRALALSAYCQTMLWIDGSCEDAEGTRLQAIAFARRAIRAAADDPEVLSRAANIFALLGENIDVALELAARALEINPNHAAGWFYSAWVQFWAGKRDVAMQHLAKAAQLSPHERGRTYYGIGLDHFFSGRYEEAKVELLRSVQEYPNWVPNYRALAACHAHLGQFSEAQRAMERLRELTPVIIPSASQFRDPELREFFLESLRLAISPESTKM